MNSVTKTSIAILIVISLLLPLLAACGDDDEDKTPSVTTPAKDVVITIGNLTDLTGPTAQMNIGVNIALNDVVRYFTDENLIPGVKLEIESYDGQMNPAKDIPAYEWLKAKGSDMMVCSLPQYAISLSTSLAQDEIPLFSLSAADEVAKGPPGWAFLMNTQTDAIGYTSLKWIAENHWDYRTKGPAKIGGASWNEPWSGGIMRGMEDYAKAHPDQFEWIGGFLTNYSFTWGTEVEALKNADYVMPAVTGAGFLTFIKEYRQAGGKAQFICNEGNTSSLGMITEAGAWNLIDGALVLQANRALSEDAELVNLCKEVTGRYHNNPDAVLGPAAGGETFLGAWRQFYGILTVLQTAVKNAGSPQSFTSKELYETASDFSLSWEDVPAWSWTPTKRTAWNFMAMYEYSAAEKLLIPIGGEEPMWVPVIYEP